MENMERTSDITSQGHINLPDRISDHFTKSLDNHEKLLQIINLSVNGIKMHTSRPNAIRVLMERAIGDEEKDYKDILKRAEAEAELAKQEISQDFPVLNSFATIAIWSWLEEFCKGLAANYIADREECLTIPQIGKLKIKLSDYIGLSKYEQSLYIVELLEQDSASGLKNGINRFKPILEPFGLRIFLSDEKQRMLYEFQMIRNNFAHRNGWVDQRLKDACPWLSLKLDTPVIVTRDMVRNYSELTGTILLDLLYQVGFKYGLDLQKRAEEKLGSPADVKYD